jgi:hypothetical protein
MAESQTEYVTSTSSTTNLTKSETSHTYPVKNVQVETAIVNLDPGDNDNHVNVIIPNSREVNKFPVQATINCDDADAVVMIDATGVTVSNITLALADGTAVAGSFNSATQRWTSDIRAAGQSESNEPTFGTDGNVVTIHGLKPNEAGTLKITGHFD